MDELDIAASVLATAGDDDFEDEVMVEVNPGDPGPPDAEHIGLVPYKTGGK